MNKKIWDWKTTAVVETLFLVDSQRNHISLVRELKKKKDEKNREESCF